MLFCTVSFAYGFVVGIRGDIPQLDQVAQRHTQRDGVIYDSTGKRVLARLVGSESRKIVASDQISPVMKQAIVAIEDKRFFEHRGVDIRGILRAVWQDVQHKKVVQGGSTITQQFVKNAYLTSKRSISRKLKEAALAWQLDQVWSKDRILTNYLNTIYFGNGAYGIERAAQTYFGHGASRLTLAEAALLAGIPSDPSLYNPVTNRQAAHARRREVLQAMLDQKDITYNEFRLANRTPLPQPDQIRRPGLRGPAQYFVDYVKQQLVDRYGSGKVFGGGLKVITTIDLGLQQRAREAIAKWLRGPDGPAAALVALDPRDGSVLAMVGGDNYRESQFNLAVQGERQPGSSFKPFVLATALQQGIAPSTKFESKPVTISLGDRDWFVRNYEGSNLGTIDLTSATVYSDNTVYAQLTQLVQPKNVVTVAHRLGISSPLKSYFAIGLGAEAVNPLEMARAYATFANGGRRIDSSIFKNRPRVVVSVNGKKNRPLPRQVITETNAELVNQILEQVVQYGTGKRAALADRPVAGKTGTTENYGDAWFVGYTPQLVVAVWVGYPNRLVPMLTEFHGDAVAGGTYPALVWKSFMEKALPYLHDEPESFPAPSTPASEPRRLVLRDGTFQLDNGICRNTILIDYFAGRGPAKEADCKPNEVEVPNVVGSSYEVAKARLDAQPLTPLVIYKPASPGQRLHVVVKQIPAGGRLSSFGKVRIVFAKPLHGVVPDLVGLTLPRARAKLQRLKLQPVLRGSGPMVVRQRPKAGVAAAPGLRVTLWVRGGSGSATRLAGTARVALRRG
ncbi:MAG TPA: PBP1A family penicillin-binding protein [Gaiellaceae bacterium]|nr:PBP1A family penicillin-binding protein [Gaiellaceae bacterium]